MKYRNEKQLMKKLDIDSWRNLSRDKIVQFATMMPDMDKELMFKVIEQFPEFTKFGKVVLDSLEESVKQIVVANSKDYEESLSVIRETQAIIKEQLNKPEISNEERKYLIESLVKVTEMVMALDKNNKRFLKGIHVDNIKVASMLLLTAVAVLGGKAISNFTDSDNDDEDTEKENYKE